MYLVTGCCSLPGWAPSVGSELPNLTFPLFVCLTCLFRGPVFPCVCFFRVRNVFTVFLPAFLIPLLKILLNMF